MLNGVNGVPNKITAGAWNGETWDEVKRHCGKNAGSAEAGENNKATKFYTGDKFGLFIDLRSMQDNTLHGSGLRLMNTEDGVQLEITRAPLGSGSVRFHIFIMSDAQFSIINNELESMQH